MTEKESDQGWKYHLYKLAQRNLHSPERINYGKQYTRQRLLEDQPGLAIEVDVHRIQNIAPIIDIKCVPTSSVARKQAIKGSDIDGGLVLSNEPIALETQHRIIEEIRAQGFSVFHPDEIKSHNLGITMDLPGLDPSRIISFRTISELEAQIADKSPLTHDLEVYLGGIGLIR